MQHSSLVHCLGNNHPHTHLTHGRKHGGTINKGTIFDLSLPVSHLMNKKSAALLLMTFVISVIKCEGVSQLRFKQNTSDKEVNDQVISEETLIDPLLLVCSTDFFHLPFF